MPSRSPVCGAHLPAADDQLGQAEVSDLGHAVGVHQDIGRGQVAVNDPLRVRGVDGPGQGLQQFGRRLGRLWGAGEPLRQGAAFDQLEHQEGRAGVLPHFVDRDDVGVSQPGHRLSLDPEPRQNLGTGLGTRVHHLHRDRALQLGLPGPVHHRHAASAQHAQDLVTGDLGIGRGTVPRLGAPLGVQGRRASSPDLGRFSVGFHRLMQLDLQLQHAGILREAALEFLERRPLALLFAEQVLGEHQIDGAFRTLPHDRKGVQIGLGRHPLAQPRSFRLVDPQDADDLLRIGDPGPRQEVLDAGLLTLAPQSPELSGRVRAVWPFQASRLRQQRLPLGRLSHGRPRFPRAVAGRDRWRGPVACGVPAACRRAWRRSRPTRSLGHAGRPASALRRRVG